MEKKDTAPSAAGKAREENAAIAYINEEGTEAAAAAAAAGGVLVKPKCGLSLLP